MATEVLEHDIKIPNGLADLAAFRRWARSADYPERGRFTYWNGTLGADLSMEDIYEHFRLKMAFWNALWAHVNTLDLGDSWGDRVRLTHVGAGLSVEPDLFFVSHANIDDGRTLAAPADGDRSMEVEGSPDMILEILCDSSVTKDHIDLPAAHARAGVEEYWVADGRHGATRFDILKLGPDGYTAAPALPDGWCKSVVFRREFRVVRSNDRYGHPRFTVEVR